VAGQGSINVTASSLINGGIIAGFNILAGTAPNQTMVTPGNLNLTVTGAGPAQNLSGGAIWADSDASVNAVNASSFTNAGSIEAANNLTITTPTLNSPNGTITSGLW